MKKTLNTLVVFNAEKTFLTSNKSLSVVPECIPAGSCDQELYYLCISNISELAEYVENYPIDLIIYFGLGHGILCSTDYFKNIRVIQNDQSFMELFANKSISRVILKDMIHSIYNEVDYKKAWPTLVKTAKTKEDLDYIINRSMTTPMGLDTETNSILNPFLRSVEPRLTCFSVAWVDNLEECWAIPTSEKTIKDAGCEYTLEESIQCAEQVFFETNQPQYWQNAHYDLLILFELFGGRQPKNFQCDTMLLLALYHKAMKSCSLASNVSLVGLPAYKDAAKEWLSKNQSHSKKAVKLTYEDVPTEILCPYAAIDALAVVRLMSFMKKALTKEQWQFYFNIAHDILLCSIELCVQGYEISKDRHNFAKLSVEKEIEETYNWFLNIIEKYVDKETFNFNSNNHLRTLLFDKLSLPQMPRFKTKGGEFSVGAAALDNFILFHPSIFTLVKLKKSVKLYTSYIKSYTSSLGSGTRHCSKRSNYILNVQLKQINRTARLSSTNMNGWDGTSRKGGSLLTLPSSGTFIKQFFEPPEVVELENQIYDKILDELKIQDEEKYDQVISNLTQDITKKLKPKKN